MNASWAGGGDPVLIPPCSAEMQILNLVLQTHFPGQDSLLFLVFLFLKACLHGGTGRHSCSRTVMLDEFPASQGGLGGDNGRADRWRWYRRRLFSSRCCRAEGFLFQALAKRSHLSGRGEMHSAVPWLRGGEKQLCLQQKPRGDRVEPGQDSPVGRALWVPSAAPSLQRAGLAGSWRDLWSCCSPVLPEQLVALAGCPTPEQAVSDLVCREGNDAHCPGSCCVLALCWS